MAHRASNKPRRRYKNLIVAATTCREGGIEIYSCTHARCNQREWRDRESARESDTARARRRPEQGACRARAHARARARERESARVRVRASARASDGRTERHGLCVLCVSRSERHVVRVFMCEEGLAHGRARQGALKRFLPRTMIVYHRTRKHPHCNHARAKSIEKSKLRKPAQLLTIHHVSDCTFAASAQMQLVQSIESHSSQQLAITLTLSVSQSDLD